MRTILLAALASMALLAACVPRPDMVTLDDTPLVVEPAQGDANS